MNNINLNKNWYIIFSENGHIFNKDAEYTVCKNCHCLIEKEDEIYFVYTEKDLTCNEIIIKDIIE